MKTIPYLLGFFVFVGLLFLFYLGMRHFNSATTIVTLHKMHDADCYVAASTDGIGISCINNKGAR